MPSAIPRITIRCNSWQWRTPSSLRQTRPPLPPPLLYPIPATDSHIRHLRARFQNSLLNLPQRRRGEQPLPPSSLPGWLFPARDERSPCLSGRSSIPTCPFQIEDGWRRRRNWRRRGEGVWKGWGSRWGRESRRNEGRRRGTGRLGERCWYHRRPVRSGIWTFF